MKMKTSSLFAHLVTRFPVQIAFSCSECPRARRWRWLKLKVGENVAPISSPEKDFFACFENKFSDHFARLPTEEKLKEKAARLKQAERSSIHCWVLAHGDKDRDKQQMMRNVRNLIYFRRDYRFLSSSSSWLSSIARLFFSQKKECEDEHDAVLLYAKHKVIFEADKRYTRKFLGRWENSTKEASSKRLAGQQKCTKILLFNLPQRPFAIIKHLIVKCGGRDIAMVGRGDAPKK